MCGSITLQGAKNSALPILAASLMANSVSTIHNCPMLTDVDASLKILNYLGCKTKRDNDTVIIDPTGVNRFDIPDDLMREMRSSVVFLGAIVSKMGKASISTPGGCEIGQRPIDLHLSSLRELGLIIEEEHGYLECRTEERLKGARINLSIPSVGATENIMLAASTAKGETTIINAAREPEISDLADFLNGCGARIYGAGEGIIRIEGVDHLEGTEHMVIPDRIVASTYMAAAAVTRGHLNIKDIIPAHLGPVMPAFEDAGCDVVISGREMTISAPPRLKKMRVIRTMPYPGFPTDAQAPVMAMATICEGTSMFVENIFECRYKHINEFIRLGAHIKVEDRVAVVEGVPSLSGAPVVAADLRGAAALIVAGLAARGTTEITGLEHLDRGYENMERCLENVGASIKRIEDSMEGG